nr:leukocyte elastase inhibitor-like [Penaeus vannamei]
MYISVSPSRLSVVGESALREEDFSRSSVTLGRCVGAGVETLVVSTVYRCFKALPPSGNFFISPFSVWSALVLAYFGSRGNTKAELEQVLRLTNREDTLALFRALERRYDSQEANQNYTINSANRIYFDQSIPVRECVGKVLDDQVKFTDFNRPDAAAADINAFINAETRGKIPKLIEWTLKWS